MGKSLFDNFKIAKEIFEEASDATAVNLKKLCFDGPECDLTLTENTQPCLVTVSVAAFRVAETQFGFKPAAVAGHSLGEYSALVAAGALKLSTAVSWVQKRGRAMQKAVPAGEGKMAAVLGLEDADIEALCRRATDEAKAKRATASEEELTVEPIVEPANFNAPGQVVIAGSVDAVTEAITLIQNGTFPGGKAILLPVSAPFHCRLMKPAREVMQNVFAKALTEERPGTLRCPYVPNRTARFSTESSIILELLVDQIDHPVLWKQSIETLMANGLSNAVEFGPGKVLQGLSKRISKPLDKPFDTTSIGDLDSIKTLEKEAKT
jgi:[acyl-carrier-protein] S-malonyltransferase